MPMSSWDAAVVIGSSYSPFNSLTLLGFLSRGATAGCLCLEGDPGSVLGAMVSLLTRSSWIACLGGVVGDFCLCTSVADPVRVWIL